MVGASLRVLMARIAANPLMPIGTIVASEPPARKTSASSSKIIRQASPMAWHAVAHAETGAKFGPLQPNSIETSPLAMFAIIIGMVNGDTRPGPFLSRISC